MVEEQLPHAEDVKPVDRITSDYSGEMEVRQIGLTKDKTQIDYVDFGSGNNYPFTLNPQEYAALGMPKRIRVHATVEVLER